MKPTFIGIGAHKCASTWVYRVLQDHPEVFVSRPKEVEYFSRHRQRSATWYEDHFTAGAAALARGEISTTYFNWPDTPRVIHDYDPDLRLVLSLRDPVRRAYSHHLFALQQGELDMRHASFEAGLDAGLDYLRKSSYAQRLREWLAIFPREQLLVLFLEDIAAAPQRNAERLYAHLGVDPRHVSANLDKKANQSYLPRSRGVKSLVNSGSALAQRLGFADTLWKVRQTPLVSRLLELNKADVKRRVPPMREETIDRLTEYFHDDVLETATLLGLDALPWETWRRIKGEPRP